MFKLRDHARAILTDCVFCLASGFRFGLFLRSRRLELLSHVVSMIAISTGELMIFFKRSQKTQNSFSDWIQKANPLSRLGRFLELVEIRNPDLAQFICQVIPSQCPFERNVQLFGHTLFHIPPLCKLNPFYEQFVGLRFRALSFLADECGQDVAKYCH